MLGILRANPYLVYGLTSLLFVVEAYPKFKNTPEQENLFRYFGYAPWIMLTVAGFEILLAVLLLAAPHIGVFAVFVHGGGALFSHLSCGIPELQRKGLIPFCVCSVLWIVNPPTWHYEPTVRLACAGVGAFGIYVLDKIDQYVVPPGLKVGRKPSIKPHKKKQR